MESVEASGKSIEDAILQALARLGRNRDEVDITVLQQPIRGTRGMGAREARVRVYLKAQHVARAGRTPQDAFDADGDRLDGADSAYALADDAHEAYGYGPPDDAYGEAASAAQAPTTALRDLLPEDASIEEIAVTALEAMLAHMGVRAAVEVADTSEEEPLMLNIEPVGNASLSLLIGRRGETLAALQLLVNLITAKQTGEREHVIVDVEGYRGRREDNLRSMAARLAAQVRASGRPVMLEAMPPYERRIIHLALAEYDDISTESTGEGEQRRVVVALKHGERP